MLDIVRAGVTESQVGVTPEMFVAHAEQVSRERSLASQRDWPGAAASYTQMLWMRVRR
jgi:hypothetical protein